MKRIMVDMSATLLHHGHVRLIKEASAKGSVIVALTTDEEILRKKGYDPELSYEYREELLLSIKYVDEVVVFETDSELGGLISRIEPDVMVVGSEYKYKTVKGSEHCREVKFFDRIGDYSTTKILEEM